MDSVQQRWQNSYMLRWDLSHWCNYRCSYCVQEHGRKQTVGGGVGHWHDVAPLDEWMAAFDWNYVNRKLVLTITGGEPFLDYKHFPRLLEKLCSRDYVEYIRVDTNGSWNRAVYKSHPKVRLMVSYHPEHVGEDKFARHIATLQAAWWHIGVVTIVLKPTDVGLLDRMKRALSPVPVNVNPLDWSTDGYTDAQLDAIRQHLPPPDFQHRIGDETLGKPCLFPSIAHEMQPDGTVWVGCHKHLRMSFFHGLPAGPVGYSDCPHMRCDCLDKYSFLQDIGRNDGATPMDDLAEVLPHA
jgi:Radical SAM superfamily/4Fe-4S single cluster domain